MIRYIALLRGINVGGHKIIKMEELAQLFAALKFKEVKTFIQSGNVLFNAPEQSIDSLQQKIEKHLHKSLGYEVTTLLRTPTEFQQIITGNPFAYMPDDEVKKYVAFLGKNPSAEQINPIAVLNTEYEAVHISNKEAYIFLRKNNPVKERFTNTFLEKKLSMPSTIRNWATVNKLGLLQQNGK